MKRKYFLLLIIVFISETCVGALPADTTKKEVKVPPVVHFIFSNALHFDSLHYFPLDTNLEDVQVINPAIEKFYNNLGTISSASSAQIFNDTNFIFTDVGIHAFDLSLKKSKDIRYYKTNTRLSEIKYHMASGSEQQISVMLTQNITPAWNAGIDFNRLGAPGFMKNSKSYLNNIDLYTWYHTKDNRYTVFASALWNTVKNEVSGGLKSDSAFNFASVDNSDQIGLPVYLNDGMQQFHNHEFSLTQSFDIGNKRKWKLNDSVSVFDFHPAFRIEHAITFESAGLTYSDNATDSTFYQNFFYRSATYDSLHYYNMFNKISLRSIGNKRGTNIPHYLVGEISLTNQWMQYTQQRIDSLGFANDLIGDTIIPNMAVEGVLRSREDSILRWRLNYNYVFSGPAKDNYTAGLDFYGSISPAWNYTFAINSTNKSPSFISENYYSNHFIWENDFKKMKVWTIALTTNLPKYNCSFGMTGYTIDNYLYFDRNANPSQANMVNSDLSVINYFLQKDFHYKKFHLTNYFCWQNTQPEFYIHLPEFLCRNTLYYQTNLFKNKLQAQIGFDLHYNQSYYADAFMPATNIFYWQDSVKTGGYALIDFFFNFKIKSAKIFLKMHNIGDNIVAKGYYLTPHYPQPGLLIQFGVEWRFFD